MVRRVLLFALLLVAGIALASCSGRSLKGAGSGCNATSECEEGLTCDFGQDPPVCAMSQTGGDGDIDASPIDGMEQTPLDAAPDAVGSGS
jgi:hypothetical protein